MYMHLERLRSILKPTDHVLRLDAIIIIYIKLCFLGEERRYANNLDHRNTSIEIQVYIYIFSLVVVSTIIGVFLAKKNSEINFNEVNLVRECLIQIRFHINFKFLKISSL
jgi:hypothetical protein